jgi:hypothetical protein
MQRSRFGSIFAVGAVAVGALLTQTAPIAYAQPIGERTIKSECQSAGGSYQSWTASTNRYSTCTYSGMGGDRYRDFYMNGEYLATD